MSVTRRLAAILAVDAAGYSRLMGEDEAGTARSVREHREAAQPIVASLGGRIVNTIGDYRSLRMRYAVERDAFREMRLRSLPKWRTPSHSQIR
jgi:hypothetical protein